MGVSVFNELSVTRISICLHIFKQLNSVEQRRLDLSLVTLFTNHIHTAHTASQSFNPVPIQKEYNFTVHSSLFEVNAYYMYIAYKCSFQMSEFD